MTKTTATLVVLAYAQEAYVRDCVRSVFANADPSMEVILSDDHSCDGTYAILEEEAAAARAAGLQVVLNRNERNLGMVAHLNRAMTLAHGEIVVYCAGDDVLAPGRVRHLLACFKDSGASVVFSNAWVIDRHGRVLGRMLPGNFQASSLEAMCRTGFAGMPGCTAAWRREVFTAFGPLPERLANEDDQIGLRGHLLDGVHYTAEPLLYYRRHDLAITGWTRVPEDAAHAMERMVRALDNYLHAIAEWQQAIARARQSSRTRAHDWTRLLALLDERVREGRLARQIMTQPCLHRRVALALGRISHFADPRNLLLFGLVGMLRPRWAVGLYKFMSQRMAQRWFEGPPEEARMTQVPSFAAPRAAGPGVPAVAQPSQRQ